MGFRVMCRLHSVANFLLFVLVSLPTILGQQKSFDLASACGSDGEHRSSAPLLGLQYQSTSATGVVGRSWLRVQ